MVHLSIIRGGETSSFGVNTSLALPSAYGCLENSFHKIALGLAAFMDDGVTIL